MTWLWIIIVFAAFVFVVGTFIVICQRKDEEKLELRQQNNDLRYIVSYARGMLASISQADAVTNKDGFATAAIEEIDYMQQHLGRIERPDDETEAVDA